jgi:formate hydrogenlyase subunit 3/multisubunit Na+/H+ antiporter MnhD subunit
VKRALIFILFGMGGTWFILASLMNGEGVLSFDWAMVIPAFIFSIIPMVYSLIWPQTRKTHKGTKKS